MNVGYLESNNSGIKFKEFRIWHYKILERARAFVQTETESDNDLKLLLEYIKLKPFKEKQLSVIGIEYINSLLLYDISPLVQEEEIYSVLKDISKGLCNITMFDTITPHKVLSAGVCLIEYDDYFTARHGMFSIIQRHAELRTVLSPIFKIMWAEPLFDYSSEFALYSRAIEVKNVPLSCTTEYLHDLFKKYGDVLKIRRYSTCSIIYFSKASEAKEAYENLMEFELSNGITCKVSMAKLYIEESAEQSIDTFNIHEMNPDESMGLVQQLLYETTSISEMLSNKARNIIKMEASKVATQQEQPIYDINPVDTLTLQGKRPPEIERGAYQYKKIKLEDSSFGGGGFYDQRYSPSASTYEPRVHSSVPYQYRASAPPVRNVVPEPGMNWEQRRLMNAGVPRTAGFTRITREEFNRMPKEDRFKYVQQYVQMVNSRSPQ